MYITLFFPILPIIKRGGWANTNNWRELRIRANAKTPTLTGVGACTLGLLRFVGVIDLVIID